MCVFDAVFNLSVLCWLWSIFYPYYYCRPCLVGGRVVSACLVVRNSEATVVVVVVAVAAAVDCVISNRFVVTKPLVGARVPASALGDLFFRGCLSFPVRVLAGCVSRLACLPLVAPPHPT